MKYYKNNYGEVFAYESDGSQDEFIQESLVLMSDSEASAFLDKNQGIPSKEDRLAIITVTTQSGKTFDGNETARSDMLVALTVGEWINETQTYWKMANNDTLLVTKEELQEALTLAIQAKGRIVGAIE